MGDRWPKRDVAQDRHPVLALLWEAYARWLDNELLFPQLYCDAGGVFPGPYRGRVNPEGMDVSSGSPGGPYERDRACGIVEIANVFAGLFTVILIGLVAENLIFRSIELRTVKKWGMRH